MTSQAIEALTHSVLIDPSNPTSLLHLGLAYFKNAEWDKAKPRLNKAVEANPAFASDAEVRDALAVVNQK